MADNVVNFPKKSDNKIEEHVKWIDDLVKSGSVEGFAYVLVEKGGAVCFSGAGPADSNFMISGVTRLKHNMLRAGEESEG